MPTPKSTSDIDALKVEIAKLREENEQLKRAVSFFTTSKNTVRVPEQFKPIFDQAENVVGEYFNKTNANPSEGTITINDERYVLLRASSLSVDFLNKIKNLYADKGEEEAYTIGRKFLFDIAHVLGIEDAKNFHEKMNLNDPVSKLSAGPVHFAYSGWAFVDILPESNPSPDDNFFLKYHHPFSFEADSWINKKEKSPFPVCIMNSGYSSGWCEESFGIPLTAVEVSCRAKGDDQCTFIMAPPHKIEGYLEEYKGHVHDSPEYDIPLFFERKKAEEKIAASLIEKDVLLKEVHHRVKNNLQIISSFINLQSHFLTDAKSKDIFNDTRNRIKALALVHEKLHNSKDVMFVNLEDYINSIVELLRSTYYADQMSEINIEVEVSADERFHIDVAIPCGLLINELVSNSYKHAFPNGKKGKICITFDLKDKMCTLTVRDNGVGIPDDLDIRESQTLGLEIVLSLIEQLEGSLNISKANGTALSVSFEYKH